jgi:histidinol-phosphate aminotransferase
MNISRILRPEVTGFEPYLPGKPIDEVRRELGLKTIVKLASNENALGASKKAVAAVRKESAGVFRYPEGPGTLLRRALAKHVGAKPSEMILGAGSDELIELLAKTFFKPGDEMITSSHTFIRYKMAGDLMGIPTVVVPTRGDAYDLEAIADRVNRRTQAIFIANPNNPTGTYAGKDEVRRFFAKLEANPAVTAERPFIVFDEAYYEFSRGIARDYPDSMAWFRKSRLNVVILRTFSKVYGLAGLRVGYGVMRPEVIDAMDRVRPPFNVSNLAQSAALAALTDTAHVKKSVDLVRRELPFVVRELKKLGLEAVPSAANFVLVNVAPRKGKELFRELLKKGVIVRAMDEYDYPCHVRVSIGTPKQNRFFIQKLREVFAGK